MTEAYRQMWQELGMDLERHDLFLAALPEAFSAVFLSQSNRPQGMAYFDNLLMEAHGGRIREILDRKKEGKPVVGTFCVFVGRN